MNTPWNLPPEVVTLLQVAGASPRLCSHLGVVHNTASALMARFVSRWPRLHCDWEAVLFGAATHDIGKALHPEELAGPGHRHEAAGEWLLLRSHVPPERARFARTHGCWREAGTGIEDWLVALADKIWKGKREIDLELKIADWIAKETRSECWQVFQDLDELLQELTARAEERLAGQARVVCSWVTPGECG